MLQAFAGANCAAREAQIDFRDSEQNVAKYMLKQATPLLKPKKQPITA
jgi:hypothetical protein